MNRKYIGLARRELMLCKKSMRVNLLLYFAVMFIAVLIFLSMRFGNMIQFINEDAELRDMIVPMMKGLFVAIGASTPVAAFCSSYDDNIITDFQCGWQRYSYTLPISVDEQIKLKLGMKFAGLIPAAILGLINIGVIRAASGEPIGSDYWVIYGAMICGAFMYAFVQLPMLMKTRNRDKSGMIVSGALMVLVLGGAYFIVQRTKSFLAAKGLEMMDISDMSGELQAEYTAEMMNQLHGLTRFAWILPVLAVIVIAASMMWTKKMLKERIC